MIQYVVIFIYLNIFTRQHFLLYQFQFPRFPENPVPPRSGVELCAEYSALAVHTQPPQASSQHIYPDPYTSGRKRGVGSPCGCFMPWNPDCLLKNYFHWKFKGFFQGKWMLSTKKIFLKNLSSGISQKHETSLRCRIQTNTTRQSQKL